MYTKAIFIIIDVLGIIALYFVTRSLGRMKEYYAKWLKFALVSSIIAIVANIMIAISFNAQFACIAYSLYYASIDWIIYYLGGFCLEYTEHPSFVSRCRVPVAIIMMADTVFLMANIFFNHLFTIYTKTNHDGFVFYQSETHPFFVAHLSLCYIIL